MAGKRVEALHVLDEAKQGSGQMYLPPGREAMVYAALGDKDRAFALLDAAYEERDWGLVGITVLPVFDKLRSDARFSDLLGRMRLLR
jgi:hypothetical protein